MAHLKDAHDVSERRACAALNIDRSTVRYRSRRGDDTDLREAIRRIASDRRRFGYPLADRRLRSTTPKGAASTSCYAGKGSR